MNFKSASNSSQPSARWVGWFIKNQCFKRWGKTPYCWWKIPPCLIWVNISLFRGWVLKFSESQVRRSSAAARIPFENHFYLMSRLASRFPSGCQFLKRGRSGRDGYRMVSKGNRDLWLLGFLGFVGFSQWGLLSHPTSEHPARLARPT